MMAGAIRIVAAALVAAAMAYAQTPPAPALFKGRSLLDAHNAYPEEGEWKDRLDRALATGLTPLVVEQDIAYDPSRGTVVSHDATLDGSEPSLEEHFFKRVAPVMERAITARSTDQWPLLVLHLDFKSNERAHHRAVWELLVKHRAWLTTAAADPDTRPVSPMTVGPLLVLTENGTDQERDFSEWAAAGGANLLFGTIPGPAVRQSDDPEERARLLHAAGPHQLIPSAATSYRRWVNFPWMVIEAGGPTAARDWSSADEQRLLAVVNYAHSQGLLIRFYTLNGHTRKENRGWTDSYNFGGLDAVRVRWRAAIRAHVDLIATDQYEELASILRTFQ
jgi:hypothetical protein